jgi:hypothetical protein
VLCDTPFVNCPALPVRTIETRRGFAELLDRIEEQHRERREAEVMRTSRNVICS